MGNGGGGRGRGGEGGRGVQSLIRYSTSKYSMTLKTGLGVVQGH